MSLSDPRFYVARAFASDQGLVLKSDQETDSYALVDAETLQPVIGRAEDEYVVTLDEVEAHLKI